MKNWNNKYEGTIDEYLCEEHFHQISSRSDLKQRSLRFFEDSHPNKKNKMSSNMRSVPFKNKSIINIL